MSSPVTTISEIGKHEGQTVTIRGWLYNLRESGKLLFPQFREAPASFRAWFPRSRLAGSVRRDQEASRRNRA